jgi:hypothetical protein
VATLKPLRSTPSSLGVRDRVNDRAEPLRSDVRGHPSPPGRLHLCDII